MGLQIKSMYEIFNNLVDWITARTDKITDFNVGSAARTLSEAVSIQLEEFYFAMKQNVLYAIENAIYEAFDFNLRKSTAATGYVTIEFNSAIPESVTIPQGTIFCTGAAYNYLYYECTVDTFASAGTESMLVPIRCKTPGEIGNIPANSITTMVTSNYIVNKVYNATSINNGTDEETSYERKNRFQTYIKTLARGTRDAVVYGALEVEGVAGAWIDDNYIGYAKLYVHDIDGNLPIELRTDVVKNLDNYRAAGIEIEVLPIVKTEVDLSLKIMLGNDYPTSTYNDLILNLVEDVMNQYTVAKSFYTTDIIHAIMTAYDDAVVNIVVVSGGDVTIQENALVRPGNVEINCINFKDWK